MDPKVAWTLMTTRARDSVSRPGSLGRAPPTTVPTQRQTPFHSSWFTKHFHVYFYFAGPAARRWYGWLRIRPARLPSSTLSQPRAGSQPVKCIFLLVQSSDAKGIRDRPSMETRRPPLSLDQLPGRKEQLIQGRGAARELSAWQKEPR